MVTVKVFYNSTGVAAKKSECRVGLSVGAFDGVYHEYTDSNGEAHFANASPGEAEIYADGKVVFKGYVPSSIVVRV